MKQKTRIASKLFAALVVLTLISCCFLGTTMARYTSTGTGTATVSVAKWDIDVTGGGTDGSTTVSFDKLSPSEANYTNINATNTTKRIKVATLKNSGEVDALVTVTVGDPAFKDINGNWYSQQTSVVDDNGMGVAPSVAELSAVFSIKFYAEDSDESRIYLDPNNQFSVELLYGSNNQAYIYAEVTWTTYYDVNSGSAINSYWKGVYADRLDTWIGENIKEVSWNLSYTAVQASELPKT